MDGRQSYTIATAPDRTAPISDVDVPGIPSPIPGLVLVDVRGLSNRDFDYGICHVRSGAAVAGDNHPEALGLALDHLKLVDWTIPIADFTRGHNAAIAAARRVLTYDGGSGLPHNDERRTR